MTSKAIPQPDERAPAQRCLEQKLAGDSYTAIAEREGYYDESGPRRAVERLLDRTGAELVAEYRAVELARLDALQAAYWGAALAGNDKAANIVLKVIGQRSKLLGLPMPERLIVASATAPDLETAVSSAVDTLRALGIPVIDADPAPAAEDADPWSNLG